MKKQYCILFLIIQNFVYPQNFNSDYVSYPEPQWIRRKYDFQNEAHKPTFVKGFDKFLIYPTPDGGKIYIYAQKEISDEKLLRAYGILKMYLNAKDGTKYAPFKNAIANTVAQKGKFFAMLKGRDGELKLDWIEKLFEDEPGGQLLYEKETPLDGGRAYVENDYEYRDAAYEEILHFVHDYGIGTRFTNGILKNTWQAALQKATDNALKNKLWGFKSLEWVEELREEGSLTQEYLASLVDSYYGLWANWNETEGGMWGEYVAKTRREIRQKDPKGWKVLVQYFPEYLTLMPRISKDFTGTFSINFNPEIPYTHKSQYFLNARLTGKKNTNLLGNHKNNIFIGNAGNNILNGQKGEDTVQVLGKSSEYILTKKDANTFTLKEKKNPKHTDTLLSIEKIIFQDKTIELQKLNLKL